MILLLEKHVTTPARPLVSVVVPAFNAERTIERCLEALHRQTYPRERTEVIVADDGSSDHTADLARDLGARVVRLGANGGAAAARNAGVLAARGDLVVFTDSDCEPTDGMVEALVAPLERDPALGGTKGTYLSRQSGLVARFVQLEYETRYEVTRRAPWIDFVDTYAACFRREHLLRTGGFDARIRLVEDQELSFRLAEEGVRVRFVPEAATFHRHAETLGAYLRKKRGIALQKVGVLRRHPGKLVRDSHTPQSLKLEMLAAAASVPAALAAALLARTLGAGAALLLAGAPLAVFLACAAPLTLRALRRDRMLGLAAPGILWLRDLALFLGLLEGLRRAPRIDVAGGPTRERLARALDGATELPPAIGRERPPSGRAQTAPPAYHRAP
jgi:GT2 family glycosyltransferase